MTENILNHVLKSDIKNLKLNLENIVVSKGTISGHSIEVEDKETNSQSSYIYYGRKMDRDKDFDLLMDLLNEK
jgi:hypothetical protein